MRKDGKIAGIQAIARETTESKKAKEAQRESEERLRNVFETMAEGMVLIDGKGTIIRANPVAERIAGLKRSEIEGQMYDSPDWPLLRADGTRMPPEEMPGPRTMKEKRPIRDVTMGVKRPDGSISWIYVNTSPIFDESGEVDLIVLTFADITKRKRAEEHLRKVEWLFESRDPVHELQKQDYGDLTKLNTSRLLLDSVREDILRDISRDYLDLLETSGAVYEKNGDYALGIFSSGWCKFLDNASRMLCGTDDNRVALKSGKWLCHESCWEDASKISIDTGQPVDIECNGGINIYAVPILAGEETVGSINFGYGDPPTDSTKLEVISKKFQVPVEDLEEVSRFYESRPPFIIEIAKERLESSARLIGEIIERRQAEKKLEKSEEEYRSLVERAGSGIAVSDLDGNFSYVNEELCKMIGYSEKELIGKPFIDFIHEEDKEEIMGLFLKAFTEPEEDVHLEFRVIHGDGHVIDLYSKPTILRHGDEIAGFNAIITDITELKKAKVAIQESEEKYRALVDNASDFIYMIDKKGKVLSLNKAAARIFGKQPDEITGMMISEVFPKEIAKNYLDSLKDVFRTGTMYSSEGTMNLGEKELWVSTNLNPVRDHKGEIVAIQGVTRDITDRKRAEEELFMARKLASIGQLAAGVAHEINNPLANISLLSENISMITKDKEIHRKLNKLNDQRKIATSIIQSLLNFSRTIEPRFSTVDLNSIGSKSLSSFETDRLREVRTVMELQPDLPNIKGDPEQLRQVFNNLVDNAFAAMPEGGRLTLTTAQVNDKFVEARIKDTGHGIPEEDIPQVFDPFFTRKDVGDGVGLGLSICHGIVKAHNGTIDVESETGKGTTFVIRLPVG
jgi:PAS domain S-box-containing protein